MSLSIDHLNALSQIFGALMIFFGLLINAFQFRKQQIWQSKQFASEQMTNLFNLLEYRNVVRMLAWDGFPVDLFPEEGERNKRYVNVTHDHLLKLLDLSVSHENYSEIDYRIIDNVDVFLTELDRYARNVQSGFFPISESLANLNYILDNLSSRSPTEEVFCSISKYIERWSYDGILWLVSEYDRRILSDGT